MHRRSPGIIRTIKVKLAGWLLSHADSPKANANASLGRNAIRILFDLAGFTLLTIAGFQISSLAGFIVAGFSCFILARHLGPRTEPKPDPLMR